MRRHALLALLLLAAPTAGLAEEKSLPPPAGVEAFMESGEPPKSLTRVRGIVVKSAPDKELFSLADVSDREEVIQTGKTQCVTLPVRWTKEMPRLHSVVVVEGQVREMDGKSVFVAESVSGEGP